MKPKSETSKF